MAKYIQIFEYDDPLAFIETGEWGKIRYLDYLELKEAEFLRAGRKVKLQMFKGQVGLWADQLAEVEEEDDTDEG